MNSYQTLQQKLVGLAFILGPLLLLIGATAYTLGIGMIPLAADSWVNAVFQTYGGLVMIPVYFELARILGRRAPRFGSICAVAGLSWGLFALPAALKLIQQDLVNVEINEALHAIVPSHSGWIPLFVGIAILHLTPILFGIGFLWKGGHPRWAAGLLILGAAFLAASSFSGDQTSTWQASFYPLFALSFLIALAPIGLRYVTRGSKVYEFDLATA